MGPTEPEQASEPNGAFSLESEAVAVAADHLSCRGLIGSCGFSILFSGTRLHVIRTDSTLSDCFSDSDTPR